MGTGASYPHFDPSTAHPHSHRTVTSEPAVVRQFKDEWSTSEAAILPMAVREWFGHPSRSTFDRNTQWMILWLESNVSRRVLLHCRLPDVARVLYDEPLTDEEHRIVEWLRTGFIPLADSFEDPLPPPEMQRRRLSLDHTPRTIRPDEKRDNWWCDSHLWKPFRRFVPHQPDLTWYLYTLQPGVKLYHGTNGGVTHDMVLERSNFFGDWAVATTFFATSFRDHHANGGVVLQFVVTKPLLLLAVDHTETVRTLETVWQKDTEGGLVRRLQVAFPWALDDTQTEQTRRYGSGNDVALFTAICASLSGIDGTASRFMTLDVMSPASSEDPPLRRSAEPEVPPELFLCNPRSALMKCEHVWAAPWSKES